MTTTDTLRAAREALTAELRRTCDVLRTKPLPLNVVIPMLQAAADALEADTAAQGEGAGVGEYKPEWIPVEDESHPVWGSMGLAAAAAMRNPGFSGLTREQASSVNATNVVRQVVKAAVAHRARFPEAYSAPAAHPAAQLREAAQAVDKLEAALRGPRFIDNFAELFAAIATLRAALAADAGAVPYTPMTDEQITTLATYYTRIFNGFPVTAVNEFARAIEAHHFGGAKL